MMTEQFFKHWGWARRESRLPLAGFQAKAVLAMLSPF